MMKKMNEALEQWLNDAMKHTRKALMNSLEDRAPIDVHHHGYNHGYLQCLKDVLAFIEGNCLKD